MDQFRNILGRCNLHDLGYKGARYTWTNGQQGLGLTRERLDRAVANEEWCAMYRKANVHVLAARSSDLAPLLLQFSPRKEARVNYNRRFKFEAKWQLEDEYSNILEGAWKNKQTEDQTRGSVLHVVQNKLVTCQSLLTRWSGRKYGDSRKILK